MEAQPSRLGQARDWYLQAIEALPPRGWTKGTLCEGWTATNIVAHVATGDQLIRGLVWTATGKDHGGQDLPKDFAERQQRFEVLSTVAEAVQQAPDAIVTMPFGPVPMPVLRGMRLNEYIIHGHDLMPAIGRTIPSPDWFFDRALGDAATRMTRLHPRSPHRGKSASFHLHRTDGDGEWILRAEGGQAVAEPGHARADVAMRGTAEGLYWVLMGRGKPEEHGVEVHGDPTLAAAFKEWFPGP